jgi:aspartate carbamoyltransferase regulatory subunit
MLYHREENNKLTEYCKNCGFKRESQDTVVATTMYKITSFQELGTKKYLVHDPTLPRTTKYKCPNDECPSRKDPEKQEAIFINDRNTLQLIYICVTCNTEWKYS